jgi:nicotinamidase-related amidase
MANKNLSLSAQYFQESTPADIPCREENFVRREIPFSLPVEQTALVLVDLWNAHHIDSWVERAEEIVKEKIVPITDAARKAGLTVVHAPSPELLKNNKYDIYQSHLEPDRKAESAWPPKNFRLRQEEFAAFQMPSKQPPGVDSRWQKIAPILDMTPHIRPEEGEYVIANAEQLQALCAKKKFLHLIYAGFATNWCVLQRDYGMIKMSERGYNCLLIRDATEGVEYPDTLEQKWAREIAIRETEQRYGFSISSEDFLGACRT